MRPARLVSGMLFAVAAALLALEALLQLAALLAPMFLTAVPGAPENDNAVRILVVGDSHAAGAGVAGDDNLPAHLKRLLVERHPENEFELVNLGLPGMNSPWVANRLEANIRTHRPNLIIVWVGVNNIWNATETGAWGAVGWGTTARRVLLHSKIFRLATVVWYTGGWDPDQQVAHVTRHTEKPAPNELERGLAFDLERMAATARSHDVPILFINYPVPYSVVSATIGATGQRVGVPVIETDRDVWRAKADGHANTALFNSAAGPHPTGILYRYVAESVVGTVEDLLRQAGVELDGGHPLRRP